MNYSLSVNDISIVLRKNKMFICTGKLFDNFYYIIATFMETNQVENTLTHKRKQPTTNQKNVWHLRLGHIILSRIPWLLSSSPLETLVLEALPLCESCIKGKMMRRPFKSKEHRAFECLELVHTDVCGPFNVCACKWYEYFITFTYDYSRYGYVYLMVRKFDAFDKFKEFKVE